VAETTRAPLDDPADLITDEDLYAVQDLISAGAGLDVALYEYAPGWRARWVAEALDQVAAGLRIRYMSTPGGRATAQALECKEIADRMREEAAAYRAGER
jgi:hypothetical protein